jgi:hypothetical protein
MQSTASFKLRAEDRDEEHEVEMLRTRRQANQKQKWDENAVHTLDLDDLNFGNLDDEFNAADNLAKTTSLNKTLRSQRDEQRGQPRYMTSTVNTASRNERNRVHENEHYRMAQERSGDRFDRATTHHPSLALPPTEELRYYQEIRNLKGATSAPSKRPDRL